MFLSTFSENDCDFTCIKIKANIRIKAKNKLKNKIGLKIVAIFKEVIIVNTKKVTMTKSKKNVVGT